VSKDGDTEETEDSRETEEAVALRLAAGALGPIQFVNELAYAQATAGGLWYPVDQVPAVRLADERQQTSPVKEETFTVLFQAGRFGYAKELAEPYHFPATFPTIAYFGVVEAGRSTFICASLCSTVPGGFNGGEAVKNRATSQTSDRVCKQ